MKYTPIPNMLKISEHNVLIKEIAIHSRIVKKEVNIVSLYLVTYVLNKPGQNYKSLYEQLETYTDKNHIMESVWLLSTTQTAQQIHDNISKGITFDNNDRLLITKITNPKQGLLTKIQWFWINERI